MNCFCLVVNRAHFVFDALKVHLPVVVALVWFHASLGELPIEITANEDPVSPIEESPTGTTAGAFLTSIKERLIEISQESRPIILLEIEPETQEISIKTVTSAPAGADAYLVKTGDTLWDIAEKFTGNPFNYPRIAANSEIQDPDLIFPDQMILISIKSR